MILLKKKTYKIYNFKLKGTSMLPYLRPGDILTFYKTKIKKTSFKNSQLQETDFTEADLTNSVFDNCNLLQAIFDHTMLEKADFRTSFNYSIDPEINRIKQARFSISEIAGLLNKYDIHIEK